MNLDEFAFMWNGTEPGWCLVDYGVGSSARYSLFNREKSQSLVIEDEVVYQEVVRRLIEVCVPIVDASEFATLFK